MKKPALLALAALMVVMSSACSKQAPAQTTPSSASETSSISAAEDSASNEPIAGVNYTSSSAAPLDESASQQAADVGIPQLQEPTAETKSLLAALESGDLSGIVGSYYSEKYGYATISEDGGITFAEVTDVDGNSYQNLKYMSFNPENGTGIAEMKTQGSLPYLYWNIYHIPPYSSHVGPPLAGPGQEIVTLFPVGVEIAWRETGYDVQSDTSKVRLFVHGSEHGTGVIEDRLDADAYFVKQEISEGVSTPPMEDISPTDGVISIEQPVGFHEIEDSDPHGFTIANISPDMDEVEYSNPSTGINVKRGELFASNDDVYLYSVTVTVLQYGAPAGQDRIPTELNEQQDKAMIIAGGENGFTPGLAQYLRDLMDEMGG